MLVNSSHRKMRNRRYSFYGFVSSDFEADQCELCRFWSCSFRDLWFFSFGLPLGAALVRCFVGSCLYSMATVWPVFSLSAKMAAIWRLLYANLLGPVYDSGLQEESVPSTSGERDCHASCRRANLHVKHSMLKPWRLPNYCCHASRPGVCELTAKLVLPWVCDDSTSYREPPLAGFLPRLRCPGGTLRTIPIFTRMARRRKAVGSFYHVSLTARPVRWICSSSSSAKFPDGPHNGTWVSIGPGLRGMSTIVALVNHGSHLINVKCIRHKAIKRSLAEHPARPTSCLKRDCRGPQVQEAGINICHPQKIDQIAQFDWNNIFVGNEKCVVEVVHKFIGKSHCHPYKSSEFT